MVSAGPGRSNLSTVLITHDVDEAIQMSDRIYLLTGSPGEIRHEIRIENPAEPQRIALDFLG